MFKAMILLKRREGMTAKEFRNWWFGHHATLAAQLPGLRGLRFNLVQAEEPLYDGVSELWFDTEEDFHSAYQSEIGKAIAEDSLANVSRRDRLFVSENIIMQSP